MEVENAWFAEHAAFTCPVLLLKWVGSVLRPLRHTFGLNAMRRGLHVAKLEQRGVL